MAKRRKASFPPYEVHSSTQPHCSKERPRHYYWETTTRAYWGNRILRVLISSCLFVLILHLILSTVQQDRKKYERETLFHSWTADRRERETFPRSWTTRVSSPATQRSLAEHKCSHTGLLVGTTWEALKSTGTRVSLMEILINLVGCIWSGHWDF